MCRVRHAAFQLSKVIHLRETEVQKKECSLGVRYIMILNAVSPRYAVVCVEAGMCVCNYVMWECVHLFENVCVHVCVCVGVCVM